MSTWIVNSTSSSVAAEGADWLDALAASLPHFNVPPGTLGQLQCVFNADGSVEVHAPHADLRLHIAALVQGSRVDAIFERCAQISGAVDASGAASVALALACEFVPCESGAVLLSTRSGKSLEFKAAFGPSAHRVLDTSIPVNNGIAGFINNFHTGTIINDVRADCRFAAEVDRASGYETHSMLAVPLITPNGPCFGCLELINAPGLFHAHDLPITQMIASALAAWLLSADA